MADTKITGLTIGVPVGTDLVPYVSDPTGSPVTKAAYLGVGTYTPTLINTTNIAASTLQQDFQYIRIGSIVHVSGAVAVDPTSAGTIFLLGISLPFASNIGTAFDVNGVAACAASAEPPAAVIGVAATDVAQMQVIPISAANQGWRVVFTYRII